MNCSRCSKWDTSIGFNEQRDGALLCDDCLKAEQEEHGVPHVSIRPIAPPLYNVSTKARAYARSQCKRMCDCDKLKYESCDFSAVCEHALAELCKALGGSYR